MKWRQISNPGPQASPWPPLSRPRACCYYLPSQDGMVSPSRQDLLLSHSWQQPSIGRQQLSPAHWWWRRLSWRRLASLPGIAISAGIVSVNGACTSDLQHLHTNYGSSCNAPSAHTGPFVSQSGCLDRGWQWIGSRHSAHTHLALLSSLHSSLASSTDCLSESSHGDAGCRQRRR